MKMKQAIAAMAAGLLLLGTAACGGGSDPATTPSGDSSDVKSCTTPTTFKLAFNQTEQHPQFIAATTYGEKLLAATNGCYTIKGYANETLGTQNDVIQNVADGSVEMAWIGGPVMEQFNSDLGIFNLPYIFASREAQTAIFSDDSVVGSLKTSIEDQGITILSFAYAGSRNVYATKPVRSPADMAGLKIRVQQSDTQVKMLNLMGGVATPMGQGDVYSALQTGALDGAENNPTVYDALKHDEIAKYYSYTQHLMIPDYLIVSTQALDQMPAEDKAAFLGLVAEITAIANDGFTAYIDQSVAAAKAKGAEFITDVDVAAFQAATKDWVRESINTPVKEVLYDAIQQANEKYPYKG